MCDKVQVRQGTKKLFFVRQGLCATRYVRQGMPPEPNLHSTSKKVQKSPNLRNLGKLRKFEKTKNKIQRSTMEPTLDDHHDKSVLPAVMQVKVIHSKKILFLLTISK